MNLFNNVNIQYSSLPLFGTGLNPYFSHDRNLKSTARVCNSNNNGTGIFYDRMKLDYCDELCRDNKMTNPLILIKILNKYALK